MTLQGVQPGDIVRVNKRGRVFLADVIEKEKGKLRVRPHLTAISYHDATAREVEAHWKKMGRRSRGED